MASIFKNIMASTGFSHQFRKVIIHHKHIGYNLNAMRQSACLVINPIMVDNFVALFIARPAGLSVRLYDDPDFKLFILVGWDRNTFACCLVYWGSTDDLLLQISSGVVW